VASLSQGRTAAAQCGLFTHKSVPVIFEPPCTSILIFRTSSYISRNILHSKCSVEAKVWTTRRSRTRFPAEEGGYSLQQCVQTPSGLTEPPVKWFCGLCRGR